MFNKAFFALGFALYLLALPGASAGPSCARRNRNKSSCMSLCAQKWGWPGNVMGSDPWGAVMSKGSSPSDALSTACGSENSGSGNGALGSGNENSNTTIVIVTSTSSSASTPTSSSTLVVTTSFSTVTTSSTPSITPPSSTSSSAHSSSSSKSSSSPTIVPPSSTSSPRATSSQTKAPVTTFAQLASQSPSQTSSQAQQSPTSQSTTQPSGNSDVTEMLQLHNNLRASHGASALTWSSTLASKAQQWANGCVFEHSGGSLGPFGENLASGTGSSYGVTDAFNGWASEESSYNPNNPVASHFTQVVWKGTSQLGCAVATCAPGTLFSSSFGSSKYYVCEYEAQGNVIGQFGSNVQA